MSLHVSNSPTYGASPNVADSYVKTSDKSWVHSYVFTEQKVCYQFTGYLATKLMNFVYSYGMSFVIKTASYNSFKYHMAQNFDGAKKSQYPKLSFAALPAKTTYSSSIS